MNVGGITFEDEFATAGQRYVEALRRLKMDLRFAALAIDIETREPRVVLVSNWADRFGSLRLYELLVEAYRAAAVPAEISPWMVEVFTEKSLFGSIVSQQQGPGPSVPVWMEMETDAGDVIQQDIPIPPQFIIGGYLIGAPLIYLAEPRRQKPVEALRQFRRFEHIVHQLAA